MALFIQVKRKPESLLYKTEVDWQQNTTEVMQNQGGYNVGMNEWELCAEWVSHHTYTLQWGACKYLKNSLGKTSLLQWLSSIKP